MIAVTGGHAQIELNTRSNPANRRQSLALGGIEQINAIRHNVDAHGKVTEKFAVGLGKDARAGVFARPAFHRVCGEQFDPPRERLAAKDNRQQESPIVEAAPRAKRQQAQAVAAQRGARRQFVQHASEVADTHRKKLRQLKRARLGTRRTMNNGIEERK